ncbi:hypothetical protein [Sulfurimonas sp.]|uniref:hypothetical protein n=1 Tax=Sulfurimonas sp. TaxID=2022749 RepID=UPI002AB2D825|nr:hypothetical protein [Sulfurimonas sp.]
MKNNLGKVFLIILIFFNINLAASTYKWSAEVNKSEVMTNEAIYLKYVCMFSDKSELYTIDFNPVGDYENYTIELLAEQEKIVDGKRVNSFEYIAYAKHAGKLTFDFDIVMKKTTQESIDATIGGRDNDRDKESFTNKYLKQKSLVVDVKDSGCILVGEFTLKVKKTNLYLKSYEPYHLEIIIEGIGNFEALKPINFKIEDVKIFSQKVIKNLKLTKEGFKGSWSQKLAFVSDESFVIPHFSIPYYDLKEKKIKSLTNKEIKVEVQRAYIKEKLLDKKEEDFIFDFDFIYYGLTFIAGFILAKISLKKKNKKEIKENSFEAKIQNSKSLQELMILLALENSKKYTRLILDIENKKITNLNKCKKIALN